MFDQREKSVPRVDKWHVVATFRRVANGLESKALTLQEIVQWSRLMYRARRLINETR